MKMKTPRAKSVWAARSRCWIWKTEEEEVYAIVGSQEANPMECRISDDSPFGRALLGHSVGEIVEVEAPIGTLRYKILSVER